MQSRIQHLIKGIYFFDFECMIDEKHVPNLEVSNKLCIKCVEVWKTNLKHVECSSDCSLSEFTSSATFAEWLFSEENKGFIAMVHNLSFDEFFIMKYLV